MSTPPEQHSGNADDLENGSLERLLSLLLEFRTELQDGKIEEWENQTVAACFDAMHAWLEAAKRGDPDLKPSWSLLSSVFWAAKHYE